MSFHGRSLGASPRFAAPAIGALCALGVACGGGGDGGLDLDDTGNPPPTERPFCANEPPHKLCADFDDGPVEQNWTLLDTRGGGAIELSPAIVRSLPNSASTLGAGNADAFAFFVKTFDGPPTSTVKVTFDMRVEKAGDDSAAASVLVVKGAEDHNVSFNIGNGGDVLGCSSTEFVGLEEPKSANCVGGLRKQVWAHVEVMVTYTAGAGEMVVHLGRKTDGEPFLRAPLTTKIGQQLQVSIGTRPYVGTGDWQVNFDNITID